MQHWSWSSAELPVVSIAAVWYSESIPDSHLQTWLTSRSSSLSFVLLHVGNCSPYLSLWLGSSALEKFNFFNGGKSQSYIELKIPIMDTCLSESPSWSVVFPVVMPVSSAVCSKTIHIHLGNKRTSDMAWKATGHLKYWKLFFLVISTSIDITTRWPLCYTKLFCWLRWCHHRIMAHGLINAHYTLSCAERRVEKSSVCPCLPNKILCKVSAPQSLLIQSQMGVMLFVCVYSCGLSSPSCSLISGYACLLWS